MNIQLLENGRGYLGGITLQGRSVFAPGFTEEGRLALQYAFINSYDSVIASEYANAITMYLMSGYDSIALSQSLDTNLLCYVDAYSEMTITEEEQVDALIESVFHENITIEQNIETYESISAEIFDLIYTESFATTDDTLIFFSVFDILYIQEYREILDLIIELMTVYDSVSLVENVQIFDVVETSVEEEVISLSESLAFEIAVFLNAYSTIGVEEYIDVLDFIVELFAVYESISVIENYVSEIPIETDTLAEEISILESMNFDSPCSVYALDFSSVSDNTFMRKFGKLERYRNIFPAYFPEVELNVLTLEKEIEITY